MNYVNIGEHQFPVLLAITAAEQAKGLMYQAWPPPAMAFLYTEPRINSFWMRNTPSPLDIIFCLNGKISAIRNGEPFSTKIIGSDLISDLVIELPAGTAGQYKIQSGDQVKLKIEKSAKIKLFMSKNGLF